MRHLFLGVGVLLFGLLVGGIGVATAGIGIGIPMIPVGIYLTYRGWRIYKHEEESQYKDPENQTPLEPLEKTRTGKVGIGVLLILIGVGTSAFIIAIPIFITGLWFIYKAYEAEIQKMLNK